MSVRFCCLIVDRASRNHSQHRAMSYSPPESHRRRHRSSSRPQTRPIIGCSRVPRRLAPCFAAWPRGSRVRAAATLCFFRGAPRAAAPPRAVSDTPECVPPAGGSPGLQKSHESQCRFLCKSSGAVSQLTGLPADACLACEGPLSIPGWDHLLLDLFSSRHMLGRVLCLL